MRLVVQRVAHAAVRVGFETVGTIGAGLLVFAGFSPSDGNRQVDWCADKIVRLRVFGDADGKMNQSVLDVQGQVLVVSQFTLYASVRRGLRPDFAKAAPPALAELLYERFLERLRQTGLTIERGRFGAHMEVRLINDGPVTLYIDTDEVMSDGI